MRAQDSHLSDQELILALDGELSVRDRGRVESHLAACWTCRARQQELEASIGDVVRAYGREADGRIPPADGPRALLKAQLDQLAAQARPAAGMHWPALAAGVAAALSLLAIGYFAVGRAMARRPASMLVVAVPDPSLTPGATVLVTRGEVCRQSNTNNKAVPVALRRRVFDEYGIRAAEPNAYEVDYLITPALGGADDIHNLWPQSYASTVWNARVKDALEDHLRDLVCAGELDLATAQREIAANWIETYKKYFHTDSPLTRFH